MNRATRDRFASGTNQADLTTGNACWQTPPLVFKKLNEDFGPFDVDLTADKGRTLRRQWFGPDSSENTDALVAPWSLFGTRGYSNPPYGPFVQKLLEKAKREAAKGFASTLLLPMRVTAAFKQHVLKRGEAIGASDLLFCDSRLTFFEHGLPRLNEKQFHYHQRAVGDPAMFDSIIVRFTPGATAFNVDTWHVPPHVTPDDLTKAFARRTSALLADAIPLSARTDRSGLLIDPA